ncbi:hypothetical protein ANO14919_057630 [Xylariales sp. No.14919]|nr:hypothetical protein ANO14919_057630 [Xylariales sp. No.14919]
MHCLVQLAAPSFVIDLHLFTTTGGYIDNDKRRRKRKYEARFEWRIAAPLSQWAVHEEGSSRPQ